MLAWHVMKPWTDMREIRSHAQEELPEDETDPEWAAYKDKISHSTDSEDSVRWRMDFMLRNLLELHPTIQRKDNQRGFTYTQRLAIFRRDKGHCQLRIKCDGVKLAWDDWHCDHTMPWTSGGKTTVKNGRACSLSELSKGPRYLLPNLDADQMEAAHHRESNQTKSRSDRFAK